MRYTENMNAITTTTKTKKLLAPWNVKVGQKLAITGPHGGEYTGRITHISTGRGIFLAGKFWRFHVDNTMFPMVQFFGVHYCNGRKYPAEKVEVIVEE